MLLMMIMKMAPPGTVVVPAVADEDPPALATVAA